MSIDIEYQVACIEDGVWVLTRDGQIVARGDDPFEIVGTATQMAEQDAKLLRKVTKVFLSHSTDKRRLIKAFAYDT